MTVTKCLSIKDVNDALNNNDNISNNKKCMLMFIKTSSVPKILRNVSRSNVVSKHLIEKHLRRRSDYEVKHTTTDDMQSNVFEVSKVPIVNIAHPPKSLSSEDGSSNKSYDDLVQRYAESYSNTMSIGYLMKYNGNIVYVGGSETLYRTHYFYNLTGTKRIPGHIVSIDRQLNGLPTDERHCIYSALESIIDKKTYPLGFEIILLRAIGIPSKLFEACVFLALCDEKKKQQHLLNRIAEIVPAEALDILPDLQSQIDLGKFFLRCMSAENIDKAQKDVLNKPMDTICNVLDEPRFCLACKQSTEFRTLESITSHFNVAKIEEEVHRQLWRKVRTQNILTANHTYLLQLTSSTPPSTQPESPIDDSKHICPHGCVNKNENKPKKFGSEKKLNMHIINVHNSKAKECDFCGKEVKFMSTHLKIGCKVSRGKPTFKCTICNNFAAYTQFDLRVHLARHKNAIELKKESLKKNEYYSCLNKAYTTATMKETKSKLRQQILRVAYK